MRPQLWIVIVILLCFASPLFAQEPATQTFTSKDGTFSFEYPVEWSAQEPENSSPPNQILISKLPGEENVSSADGLFVIISPPVKYYSIPLSKAQTPKESIEASIVWTRMAETLRNANADHPIITVDGTPMPTPNTFQPLPTPSQIIEFTVNGRLAAYSTIVVQTSGLDSSTLIIVVDVGDDFWVTLTATSMMGDLATIQKNEAIVLQIAQSLHYTLPPVNSGNLNLPRVYSGPDGGWNFGTVEFYYPNDWYISSSLILTFSNKKGSKGIPVPG